MFVGLLDFKNVNMNVLSLFDGISCGQVALENAGIKVDKYFASEIDKHAIKITQSNYPNTIQLGDVTKVKGADLPKIEMQHINLRAMANNKRMVDLMNIIINDTKYAEECHGIWSEIDNEWRLLKFVVNRIKSKCEGSTSIETLAALPTFDIRFSEARAEVCRQFDYWKTCESWTKDCRCLASCEYHLQT
jgi:hypothetical protein